MLHARVGLFEDHDLNRNLLRQTLEMHKHQVVLEVATLEAARELIPAIDPGALDIAVIDGNLRRNVVTGEDGAEIAGLLRATLGDIMLIGYSGAGSVYGVDIDVGKDPFAVSRVIAEYDQAYNSARSIR